MLWHCTGNGSGLPARQLTESAAHGGETENIAVKRRLGDDSK